MVRSSEGGFDAAKSIVDRMADTIRERVGASGACTVEDLVVAGFTSAEIVEYSELAKRQALTKGEDGGRVVALDEARRRRPADDMIVRAFDAGGTLVAAGYLAEVVGDDEVECQAAATALRRDGEASIGGGAAPFFRLELIRRGASRGSGIVVRSFDPATRRETTADRIDVEAIDGGKFLARGGIPFRTATGATAAEAERLLRETLDRDARRVGR